MSKPAVWAGTKKVLSELNKLLFSVVGKSLVFFAAARSLLAVVFTEPASLASGGRSSDEKQNYTMLGTGKAKKVYKSTSTSGSGDSAASFVFNAKKWRSRQ